MKPRIDFAATAPKAVRAMRQLEAFVREGGLESSLLELMKIRASQINGCAYCLDMHTKDARAAGETEQRLYALSAWHDAPFYSDRERAALAWTEALTLVSENHVPDELYAYAKTQFTDEELVQLTMGIIAINGWNRLAMAMRSVPGTYHPPFTCVSKRTLEALAASVVDLRLGHSGS